MARLISYPPGSADPASRCPEAAVLCLEALKPSYILHQIADWRDVGGRLSSSSPSALAGLLRSLVHVILRLTVARSVASATDVAG
jgi:hypothetical protein